MPKSFKRLVKEEKRRIATVIALTFSFLLFSLCLLTANATVVVASPIADSALQTVNTSAIEGLGDTLIILIVALIPILVILAIWDKFKGTV